MDELDRACVRAIRDLRAAYWAWRRASSPESEEAYEQAFRAWERAVSQQIARQEIWRAEQPWGQRPRPGPAKQQ